MSYNTGGLAPYEDGRPRNIPRGPARRNPTEEEKKAESEGVELTPMAEIIRRLQAKKDAEAKAIADEAEETVVEL